MDDDLGSDDDADMMSGDDSTFTQGGFIGHRNLYRIF
jgi:hypothetical protein